MSKHLIDLIDIRKSYGTEDALKRINLYIRDGEFLTLLGPSGCGKTTLLRLIAGFTMPTEGRFRHSALQAPREHGVSEICSVPSFERVR